MEENNGSIILYSPECTDRSSSSNSLYQINESLTQMSNTQVTSINSNVSKKHFEVIEFVIIDNQLLRPVTVAETYTCNIFMYFLHFQEHHHLDVGTTNDGLWSHPNGSIVNQMYWPQYQPNNFNDQLTNQMYPPGIYSNPFNYFPYIYSCDMRQANITQEATNPDVQENSNTDCNCRIGKSYMHSQPFTQMPHGFNCQHQYGHLGMYQIN